jgi:hypothetical protein
MSRCVRDRALWRLSTGEGSREERAHVASCVVCTARLRRLEQDLIQLRSVLSGPPPAALARSRPMRVRWMASAATLAAMVVVAWFGVWWQRPSLPPQTETRLETRQESIWPFLEGVSATLFPTVAIGFTAPPDRLSELDDLQAALAGEWPCGEPAAFADVSCDDDTFALLVGGP